MGHKKADYPMLRRGAVSAPALVTLRTNDGHDGRRGAPADRSRVLQCLTGETSTPAGDIVGMLSSAFSLAFISILSLSILYGFG